MNVIWVKVRTRLRRSGACHAFIPGSPRAARAGERHRRVAQAWERIGIREAWRERGGRGAVITDRDCDAPRELLLMADAHLWSVSGAGAGALLERNWDQSQVQTFMMLQYFDRKQAIPASQMNVARPISKCGHTKKSLTYIHYPSTCLEVRLEKRTSGFFSSCWLEVDKLIN